MTDNDRPPAPPQYSPDGRWYWNGHEWKPNPALKELRRADRLVVVGAVITVVLVVAITLGVLVYFGWLSEHPRTHFP